MSCKVFVIVLRESEIVNARLDLKLFRVVLLVECLKVLQIILVCVCDLVKTPWIIAWPLRAASECTSSRLQHLLLLSFFFLFDQLLEVDVVLVQIVVCFDKGLYFSREPLCILKSFTLFMVPVNLLLYFLIKHVCETVVSVFGFALYVSSHELHNSCIRHVIKSILDEHIRCFVIAKVVC